MKDIMDMIGVYLDPQLPQLRSQHRNERTKLIHVNTRQSKRFKQTFSINKVSFQDMVVKNSNIYFQNFNENDLMKKPQNLNLQKIARFRKQGENHWSLQVCTSFYTKSPIVHSLFVTVILQLKQICSRELSFYS